MHFPSFESDRRAQIESISTKHNERLEQIELKVRKDMKAMDMTGEELSREIDQMTIKLESKRAMLLSVYSSSTTKLVNTSSTNSKI